MKSYPMRYRQVTIYTALRNKWRTYLRSRCKIGFKKKLSACTNATDK